MIEVYGMRNIDGFKEYCQGIEAWSCGLWVEDFEAAGIEDCYLAFDGDDVVGFQTVSADSLCVAIEVRDDMRGNGIATALINESGCYRPERNENPGFWTTVETSFEA